MSGTIGISCQTQNNKQNKNLYFKAIDILETTYSSVKLSYLTNLDKPVNSVNVRNIEKMEPRVPEIGLGIDVGGLNFSDTSDFTPDVSLSGDTIIVNSISNSRFSTSVKGTTSNKMILTSNCNGYFSFAGTIKTGNNTSITIKSGAKVIFDNIGKVNEGCSDSNVSLEIEDGAVVHFENTGSIYGQIKTNNNSVIITKNETDFNRMKKNNKGLLITTEKYFKHISDLFDFETTQNSIIINKQIIIEHDDGMDSYCPSLIINKDCNVISNGIFMQDHYANTPESNSSQQPEPGVSESYFENNGTLTITPGSELYLYGRTANHKNNGVIYNLGNIKGQEKITGTGRIISLDFTAEVNGELYNDITVDKVNRTVTINNLNPETNYDINLIASLEPYVERSRTIKQRTIKAPSLITGSEFNSKIKQLQNINNVKEIKFIKENSLKDGVELSTSNNYIKGYITDTILNISSTGQIKSNSDSSHMFDGLTNIEKITLDNFVETDITNAESMFNGCTKLRSISNLENWNTKKITNMNTMFAECPELIGKMTLMSSPSVVDTFKNSCKVEDETNYFKNHGYFILDYKKTGSFFVDYNIQTVFNNLINKYKDTTTKILKKQANTLLPGKVFRTVLHLSSSVSCSIYFEKVNSIEERIKELDGTDIYDVSLDGSIINVEDHKEDTYSRHIISESEIFANEDCENMFTDVAWVKENQLYIYFDNFNTKKVTNMKGMFKENQTDIVLYNYNFNTDKPIIADEMFLNCYGVYMTDSGGLRSIELSKFGKIKSAIRMFAGCEYLETIGNSSRLDYADKLDEVFKNCKKLKGSMTSPSATSYTGMFEGACTAEGSGFVLNYYESSETPDIVKPMLKTGSFDSKIGFNGEIMKGRDFLSKVATLEGTKTLRHIISQDSIPSSFPGKSVDISAAQNGSVMAWLGSDNETIYIGSNSPMYANSNCASMFSSNFIETIDISKIKFKYLETVYWMFGGAEGSPLASARMPESNLRTITGIENISFKNVTSLDYMFYMCGNLTTSIVIDNPNITSYTSMFEEASDRPQNRGVINVKYIDDATKVIAEKIVNDPNTRPNVILYTLKKCLISGPEFNTTLKDVIKKLKLSPSNDVYPSILFDKIPDTYTEDYVNKNFNFVIDISEDKNKSIMLYATEYERVIEIRSKYDKVIFNENCSKMFEGISLMCNWINGKGTFSINFNNTDTSKVTNMEDMFNNFTLDRGDEYGNASFLNLSDLNTSSVTNFNRAFANMSIESITGFVIRHVPTYYNEMFNATGPRSESDKIVLGWIDYDTKSFVEMIWGSMSSWNQAYFEVPETASI